MQTDNNIYRIEYYGDGIDFAVENEKYKVISGDVSKEFENFSSAKEFYDLLSEAELVETKYDSVLEGKRRIMLNETKQKIVDFFPENHNYIILDGDEIDEKLSSISNGVGKIIIYGSILDHFLSSYIAETFSNTQGEYERTHLLISELSFAQKSNIVVKDLKNYIYCCYLQVFDFMTQDEKDRILKQNSEFKILEDQINNLQKSLEKARILRNNYAHAEYDYIFKGDMISISKKSNRKTGFIERYMKYFTEIDLDEDLDIILKAFEDVQEITEIIENHKRNK